MEQNLEVANYLMVQIFLFCSVADKISGNPGFNDVSHYNLTGYGGFGNGGAGLPGGQAGAGSKPGYPVGTGVCFYK